MTWASDHLLSLIILTPIIGAIGVLMARGRSGVRMVSLVTCLVVLGLSISAFARFQGQLPEGARYAAQGPSASVQLVERAVWIPAMNVEYFVGVDSLSLSLVLLSAVVGVLACIASWNIEKQFKGYFALFLLLQAGILGTFVALDFFLFYVFFEISLLPMYFLIGIWGGPRREYAAIKFFIYTLLGSVAMMIVMIGMYLASSATGTPSFDLLRLSDVGFQGEMLSAGLSYPIRATFFLMLVFAFFIKVPAVPLHTWLPDAHVEAPTPISMILAAILLKMGGYGLFRIAYPLFPEAAREFWWLVAIVGLVSIIYGALAAMAQTDFKKLVAYSSVSHMGFVTLGLAVLSPLAFQGAVFMMIAHGITSAALFFIVGVIYDRAHHREINRFGGLSSTMPVYSGLSAVSFFANLGLPGLCGFVAEVMVLLGVFQAAAAGSVLMNGYAKGNLLTIIGVIACTGVVFTAGYMLWMIQRVYLGKPKAEYAGFADINKRELTVLIPLTGLAILLGVVPMWSVFSWMKGGLSVLFDVIRV